MDRQTARAHQDEPPSGLDMSLLLQRARDGDRQSFHQLVLAYQGRVFTLALRFVVQRADAEDVAQDAFLQLHAALPGINSTSHLRHWLLRTVTHRSIDILRQWQRQDRMLPLEALATNPVGLVVHSDVSIEAAQLRALLHQLPLDARAVMLLRYQEDLDPTEIATVMKMSVNTVKSHLRRSLEWLRVQCGEDSHGS